MNDENTIRRFQLPLQRIALCLDCETCFEIGIGRCPTCGSGMWATMARFLDRRYQ